MPETPYLNAVGGSGADPKEVSQIAGDVQAAQTNVPSVPLEPGTLADPKTYTANPQDVQNAQAIAYAAVVGRASNANMVGLAMARRFVPVTRPVAAWMQARVMVPKNPTPLRPTGTMAMRDPMSWAGVEDEDAVLTNVPIYDGQTAQQALDTNRDMNHQIARNLAQQTLTQATMGASRALWSHPEETEFENLYPGTAKANDYSAFGLNMASMFLTPASVGVAAESKLGWLVGRGGPTVTGKVLHQLFEWGNRAFDVALNSKVAAKAGVWGARVVPIEEWATKTFKAAVPEQMGKEIVAKVESLGGYFRTDGKIFLDPKKVLTGKATLDALKARLINLKVLMGTKTGIPITFKEGEDAARLAKEAAGLISTEKASSRGVKVAHAAGRMLTVTPVVGGVMGGLQTGMMAAGAEVGAAYDAFIRKTFPGAGPPAGTPDWHADMVGQLGTPRQIGTAIASGAKQGTMYAIGYASLALLAGRGFTKPYVDDVFIKGRLESPNMASARRAEATKKAATWVEDEMNRIRAEQNLRPEDK